MGILVIFLLLQKKAMSQSHLMEERVALVYGFRGQAHSGSGRLAAGEEAKSAFLFTHVKQKSELQVG